MEMEFEGEVEPMFRSMSLGGAVAWVMWDSPRCPRSLLPMTQVVIIEWATVTRKVIVIIWEV